MKFKTALLLIFFLTSILPLGVIGFLTQNFLSSILQEEIKIRNHRLTESLGEEIDQYLQDQLSALNQINNVLDSGILDSKSEKNLYVEQVVQSYQFLEGVHILDLEGFLLFMSPFDPNLEGLNFKNQEYYSRVIESDQVFWSRIFLNLQTGSPALTVSLPCHDHVMVGHLDLTFLADLVKRISHMEYGYVIILDRDGTVIAHPNPDFVIQRMNLADFPLVQQIVDGREVSFRFAYNDQDLLGHIKTIAQTGWFLLYLEPEAVAYQSLMQIQRIILIGILVTAALMILVVIFLLSRINKPLSALTRYSQAAAKGEYRFNQIHTAYYELSELTRNFKIMIEAICSREESLVKSEENLRITLDSIGDAVFTINKGNEIIRFNPAAEALTGVPAAEAFGRRLSSLFSLFSLQEYGAEEKIDLDNINESVMDQFNLHRMHLVLSSREEHIVSGSCAPIIQKDQSYGGWIFILRDETEKISKEQQLLHAQKMEAVGRMAGGIAHDFNNILTGIFGAISVLEHKMELKKELTPSNLQSNISIIRDSSLRARDVIRQLMTISQKGDHTLSPVDLKESMSHVLRLSKKAIDQTVQVDVRFPDESLCIMGDPTQLEQVFLNLLINSVHSMTIMRREDDPWGGVITIDFQKLELDSIFLGKFTDGNPGWYWKISIRDQGVGIESKVLENIFTPFYTTKSKDQGSGLGLAMVYSIVRKFSGFINVYSDLGKGTEFHLYFPVAHYYRNEKPSAELDRHFSDTGLVLIIDDEQILREIARDLLEEFGYKTLLAEDGDKGVQLYQTSAEPVKWVLLDLKMPKKDGAQTFKALKKIDPDVKVILVSGSKNDEQIGRLLDQGVKVFIEKPYDMHKLVDSIKRGILGESE